MIANLNSHCVKLPGAFLGTLLTFVKGNRMDLQELYIEAEISL